MIRTVLTIRRDDGRDAVFTEPLTGAEYDELSALVGRPAQLAVAVEGREPKLVTGCLLRVEVES